MNDLLDDNNIHGKVSGDLSRKNGNIYELDEEGKLVNDFGFSGRITGTVGTCDSCGRPVLSSVFPFVYCGECGCYKIGRSQVAEDSMELDKRKE